MTDTDQLLALAGELIRRSWTVDIDGGELQDMLVKHGILHEVPATEVDCAEDWAQEYGVELGDPIYKVTELGQRALEAAER